MGLLLIFMMIPLWAMSQNVTVMGSVNEAGGDALPGVSIKQVGTSNGTITDLDGNYKITVPPNAKLVFSFIGYRPETISVGGKSKINVILKEDSKTLDELVVVGYGTMRKSDISGSVATVDRDAMLKKAPTNIGQALQGAAAGVLVTQNDGTPDGFAAVRIRGIGTINGSADPLYVVDGVQVGTDASFLNPADIEKIEVLKDASATAIYGSAGANGVIMVTTRQGTKGHTQIQVTADFGVQTLPNELKTLGIDEFASSVREAKANDGAGIYNNIWDQKYDGKRNYIDWQKEMTHAAVKQQYGITASGGNDKSQYNFSLGYLDNDGLVVNSNYNRLSARANVNVQPVKWLKFGGDMNFVHTEAHGSNAGFNNNGNLSSLRDLAYWTPTLDYLVNNAANGTYVGVNLVNPDGSYGCGYLGTSDGWEGMTKNSANPYASQMEKTNQINRGNRMFLSAFFDIEFMKGLNLHSIASYTVNTFEGGDFTGGSKRYNYINGNLTEMDLSAAGVDNRYSFSLNQNHGNNLGIETYLTYNWKTSFNDLTLMVGNSVSKYYGSYVSANANTFASPDNRVMSLSINPSSREGNGGFNADSRTISYYGRAIYNLFDRYIFTGTVRRDGSSNFGAGNRWGTFPSAALAWRISEEPFMKDVKIINNLKLRIGWGQTGNAGNMAGRAVPALSTSDVNYNVYSQGGTMGISGNRTVSSGFKQLLVDTNLKWETNEQTNIGVDFGILNGDLNITLDYFIRKSKNLLIDQQIRPSTGYTSIYTNYGEIDNHGLEFNLTYNKRLNKDWSINATLNGSSLKNKVKNMGYPLYSTNDGGTGNGNVGAVGAAASFYWGGHSICMNGEAVGSFYGYKVAGIWKNQAEIDAANAAAKAKNFNAYDAISASYAPGDFKYEDVNGDGHVDANDRVILGNGIPKLNYGISLGATYKNWDFSMYMYGVLGQQILSYSAMRLSTVFSADDQTFPNILKDSYDRVWRSGNEANATLPRLTVLDNNHNVRCSDAWVKNGDFLRLSNFQIGYTLPNMIINKIGITKARVYAAVQNLLTISGYNKYGDPECGQNSVLFSGLDSGRYPMPRIFMFGLNVTF